MFKGHACTCFLPYNPKVIYFYLFLSYTIYFYKFNTVANKQLCISVWTVAWVTRVYLELELLFRTRVYGHVQRVWENWYKRFWLQCTRGNVNTNYFLSTTMYIHFLTFLRRYNDNFTPPSRCGTSPHDNTDLCSSFIFASPPQWQMVFV